MERFSFLFNESYTLELVGVTAAIIVVSFRALCSRRNSNHKQMTRNLNAQSVYNTKSYRKASGRQSRSGLSNASTCASEMSAGSADSFDTEASENRRSTYRLKPSSHGTESEFKRDVDVPRRNLRRTVQGNNEKNVPSAIKDILQKLSPEDVATVKRALETGSVRDKENSVAKKPMFTQNFETAEGNTVQIRTPVRVDLSESNTFKTNLRKLATIQEARVLILKKINLLGLNSPEILKKHFSKFGVVENVFVTHPIDRRVRKYQDGLTKPRVRAAGIGFVVMQTVEDAADILRLGPQLEINGVVINVSKYDNETEEKTQDCDEDITEKTQDCDEDITEKTQDCDEDITGVSLGE